MVTNRHLHGYYWYHWLAVYSRARSPFITPEALDINKEEEVAEAINKLHASVTKIFDKSLSLTVSILHSKQRP